MVWGRAGQPLLLKGKLRVHLALLFHRRLLSGEPWTLVDVGIAPPFGAPKT